MASLQEYRPRFLQEISPLPEFLSWFLPSSYQNFVFFSGFSPNGFSGRLSTFFLIIWFSTDFFFYKSFSKEFAGICFGFFAGFRPFPNISFPNYSQIFFFFGGRLVLLRICSKNSLVTNSLDLYGVSRSNKISFGFLPIFLEICYKEFRRVKINILPTMAYDVSRRNGKSSEKR